MSEYLLQRFHSGGDATLGGIFAIGAKRRFCCFTLEDRYQAVKVSGETRIPPGRYEIKLRTEGGLAAQYEQRFPFHKGMLWLQDVPNFEWIYIHPGNTDEHTNGCILVGWTADNTGRMTIGKSVLAYTQLYKEMMGEIEAGNPVFIEIRDYA